MENSTYSWSKRNQDHILQEKSNKQVRIISLGMILDDTALQMENKTSKGNCSEKIMYIGNTYATKNIVPNSDLKNKGNLSLSIPYQP